MLSKKKKATVKLIKQSSTQKSTSPKTATNTPSTQKRISINSSNLGRAQEKEKEKGKPNVSANEKPSPRSV
jgi:hypothetical protein